MKSNSEPKTSAVHQPHQLNLAESERDQPNDEGNPKFGRLLLVLLAAVLVVVILTFATAAYHGAYA